MIRLVVACCVLCFLFVGCGRVSPPPQRPRTFAKHDLDGGRYFIECEDTGSGSSLSFRTTSEGMNVTGETYDFSWGDTRRLRIEEGRLTVDGAERGQLEPGDRITITAAGEILVNGSKR